VNKDVYVLNVTHAVQNIQHVESLSSIQYWKPTIP